MQVCPFSGMVLVGHQGGDVRLYQFTESAQSVHRINLDETLIPYENVGPQVGFLYSCTATQVGFLYSCTAAQVGFLYSCTAAQVGFPHSCTA